MSTRQPWLDAMRIFAIVVVILCHVTESIYFLSSVETVTSLPLITQFIAYSLFTIGRFGVPIFCFLTGFLLLPRSYDRNAVIAFWKKRLLPLAITFWCWTVINQIAYCAIYSQDFSLVSLVLQLLMLKQSPFGHMWYMPMIIGIYVMIPLVANVLNRMPLRILIFPFILGVCAFFLIPSLNVVLQALSFPTLKALASLDFTGGAYGLYVIAGYLIARVAQPLRNLKSLKLPLVMGLTFIAVVSFLGCVVVQIVTLPSAHYYQLWYDFFLVLTCCICIFMLGCILIPDDVPHANLWAKLSLFSLGIYFVHFPLLLWIMKTGVVYLIPLPRFITVFVLWLVLFAVSTFIVYLISKIPRLSKILIYR